jgi:SlyX protein
MTTVQCSPWFGRCALHRSALKYKGFMQLEELEARIAHQDQSILELSDEVYRQQRQIVELERQFRALKGRIEPLEQAQPGANPRDEKPPHY